MTWSLVARDPATGAFGIAVATRFFAVGALCPHGDGGVGALCTQALINPTYGPRGLRLLREGVPAQTVVDVLTGSDPGRAARQLHVQRAHDAAGDVVLQCKDVAKFAVETFRPQVLAGGCVHQLHSNARTFAPALHAAFQ